MIKCAQIPEVNGYLHTGGFLPNRSPVVHKVCRRMPVVQQCGDPVAQGNAVCLKCSIYVLYNYSILECTTSDGSAAHVVGECSTATLQPVKGLKT